MDSPVERILNPPTSPLKSAYDVIESGYDSLGLLYGESAPARRFVFGALVGSGISYLVKPSYSFDASGNPRPWALSEPNSPNKTAFPWWLPGAAFGFFSGFMI